MKKKSKTRAVVAAALLSTVLAAIATLAAVLTAAFLPGCTLYERTRTETIPLPETGIPVTTDQWEPDGTQTNP